MTHASCHMRHVTCHVAHVPTLLLLHVCVLLRRVLASALQQHYPSLFQHLQPGSSLGPGHDSDASCSTASTSNNSSTDNNSHGTSVTTNGNGSNASGYPAPDAGSSVPLVPKGLAAAVPVVRARTFDWTRSELLGERYDVLLACDVLYEDAAVQPIAELVPRCDQGPGYAVRCTAVRCTAVRCPVYSVQARRMHTNDL